MLGTERYVLSLDPCKGVSDDAMASMLSSWIIGTVHAQEWLGEDAIRSIMSNHFLGGDDIERMTLRVLDALDSCGLYTYLLTNPNQLETVSCQVTKNMALLTLEWVSPYESDPHKTPSRAGDVCDERQTPERVPIHH